MSILSANYECIRALKSTVKAKEKENKRLQSLVNYPAMDKIEELDRKVNGLKAKLNKAVTEKEDTEAMLRHEMTERDADRIEYRNAIDTQTQRIDEWQEYIDKTLGGRPMEDPGDIEKLTERVDGLSKLSGD